MSSFYINENTDTTKLDKLTDKVQNFEPVNFDHYEKTKGKNVILIVIESVAFERTPLGKDTNSPLSFLEDLAAKSCNFTSFRTFFPATTRSILGLFCSDYPGTGYRSVTNTNSDFDCNSIIDAFNRSNYDTSYFSPVLLEFDNFGQAKPVKKFDYVFEPSEVIRKGDFKRKYGTKTAIEEDIVQKKLIEHIKKSRKSKTPFFTFYFPYWTHSPYEHPFKSSRGMTDLERYYQSQEYISKSLSDFFKTLEKEKILDDTIVVVTADHGESFGRKIGNYVHPNYLYDENLKVPFLLYIKGITDKTPMTVTNPVTVFDVAPTLADLAGLKREPSWIGNNLFEGKNKPVFIYTRAMELHSGILDGNYKYFFNHVTGQEYFFDLKNDPGEEENNVKRQNTKLMDLLK